MFRQISRLARRSAGAIAVLILAACASAQADSTYAIRPAPPAPRNLIRTPAHAAPNGTILIQAAGLSASRQVTIGIGPSLSSYRQVDSARVDDAGNVSAEVQVPRWAKFGKEYVVVIAEDNQPVAVSDLIVIAATGASLTVHGRFTDMGLDCPVIRSANGKVYAVAIPMLLAFPPGTQLEVKGTIAPSPLCASATTLAVEKISRVQ